LLPDENTQPVGDRALGVIEAPRKTQSRPSTDRQSPAGIELKPQGGEDNRVRISKSFTRAQQFVARQAQ